MAQDDDSPLRRWSRRKREATRTPEPEPEGRDEPAPAPGGDSEGGFEVDADLVAALPDIDSLTLQSDFTPFLQAGVPTELRNRALARLWRTDPIFDNLDGLNTDHEDYRAQMLATAGKKIASLFRPGRGMISPQEALHELAQLAKQAGGDGKATAENVEAHSPDTSAADAAADPTPSRPAPVEPPAALPDSSGATPCSPDHGIGGGIVDSSRREDRVAVPAASASVSRKQGLADEKPEAIRGKAASRRWGRPA